MTRLQEQKLRHFIIKIIKENSANNCDDEDISLEKIANDIFQSNLDEKKIKVVRAGKIVKKTDCKDGFKAVGNKCVKMSSKEKLTRAKAQKKGAKKRKKKVAQSNRKREKSMKKVTPKT